MSQRNIMKAVRKADLTMLNRRELIALGASCALALSGCGLRKVTTDEEEELLVADGDGTETGDTVEGATLTVAATTEDVKQMLEEFLAPTLAERGVILECTRHDEAAEAFDAALAGEVSCCLCANKAELNRFNTEHADSSLLAVGAVLYEPYGIYSTKLDSLVKPKAKTKVAIPKDLAGMGHALQVLAQERLVTLADPIALASTTKDIVEDPYHLELVPTDADKLVDALKTTDACVIPPEVAFEKGLSARDAVVLESNTNIAAQWYGVSLIAPSLAAHDGAIQALLTALRSLELSYYLQDNFDQDLLQIAVVLKDNA